MVLLALLVGVALGLLIAWAIDKWKVWRVRERRVLGLSRETIEDLELAGARLYLNERSQLVALPRTEKAPRSHARVRPRMVPQR